MYKNTPNKIIKSLCFLNYSLIVLFLIYKGFFGKLVINIYVCVIDYILHSFLKTP